MIEKLENIDKDRLLNRYSLNLDGKVVLVDFWTYTCVNCLRTIPSLKSMYIEYKDYGFEIVGVHTPEFKFEQSIDNIKRAIRELEIEYPVVNDYDRSIWKAFNNRYWPSHYLFDRTGKMVHTHFGEGGYEELSEMISSLLSINKVAKVEQEPYYFFGTTPETYLGHERGKIANGPSCYNDRCNYYVLPRRMSINNVFLKGYWEINDEYIEPDDEFSELHFSFRAREINVVMDPSGNSYLNYTIDGAARNLALDNPRMYNLFKGNENKEHYMIMKAPRYLRLYVFTFA